MMIRRLLSILAFVAALFVAAEAEAQPASPQPVYQSSTVQCTKSAQTTTIAATDKLVTGLGTLSNGQQPQIYVCGFTFVPAASGAFSLFWNTAGNNCAASSGTVVPTMTGATGIPIIDGHPFYAGLPLVPNNMDLCANLAGTGSVLVVYYTQF